MGKDGKALDGLETARGRGKEVVLQRGRTLEDKLRLL